MKLPTSCELFLVFNYQNMFQAFIIYFTENIAASLIPVQLISTKLYKSNSLLSLTFLLLVEINTITKYDASVRIIYGYVCIIST